MNKLPYDETIRDLINDIRILQQKYSKTNLPPYEFGFTILRMTTDMMYCCAPNEDVAKRTIDVSIAEGKKDYDLHKKKSCNHGH